MDDKLYKSIKNTFKTSKTKPTTMKELIKFYVGLLQHVGGNDFIKSERLKSKARRDEIDYEINTSKLELYLELNSYKNGHMIDFHDGLKKVEYRCYKI